MYCTGCGRELHLSERFCPQCGLATGQAVAQTPSSPEPGGKAQAEPEARSAFASRIRLLGGLWLALALLLILAGLHESMMFSTLTRMGNMRFNSFGGVFWATHGMNIWKFTLIRAVMAGIPGFGLFTQQRWSRWVTIAMSIPVFFFLRPFGALLAIFSWYTLLRRGTAEGFRQLA